MHLPQHSLKNLLLCSFVIALCSLSQAAGTEFQQVTTFNTGNSPGSVMLADFNQDGRLDVVTANLRSNSVSVLLGNGDGTFQAAKNTNVGVTPDSLTVGDFNRDGKVDIAVTNRDLNIVSVLLGNGNGTFQSPEMYRVGANPSYVVTGDFNNDGRLDLAVVASGQLSVLLGNGDGTFQKAVNSSFSGSVLAVGDFNGDGKLDLASGFAHSVFVALGRGDGSFREQTQVMRWANAEVGPLTAVDTNRDGKLDLVAGTSQGVGVLLGHGNGRFSVLPFFGADASLGGIAAGDLNGDGRPDLVVGSSDLAVYLGRGDGTFRSSKDYMESGSQFFPAVGDLNHDNKLDVVTGKVVGSSVSVYLGNGDGTLRGARNFNNPPGDSIGKLVTSDINQDGIPDLVVRGHAMLGNGDGTFGPPTMVPSLADPELVGDFNGDGIPDIATFGANRSALVILLGNGDGTFRFVGEFDTGGSPSYATEGDFNGDGATDIAVVNDNNGGTVAVLLGNGDGTFGSPVNYRTTDVFTWFVISGDFNRDGNLDLLVGSTENRINLLLGNGDGTFQPPRVINAAGCFAAIPDLNGDKKLDLVLVGCRAAGINNDVTVLLGKGDGTFGSPVNYPAGVSGFLKIRDVNNDGAMDVIVPDSQNSGNTMAVLLGNGNGTLRTAQDYFVDATVTGVIAADFNFDNFADLAVGNAGHVSILLNTKHAAH